jgi:hypothetical protein
VEAVTVTPVADDARVALLKAALNQAKADIEAIPYINRGGQTVRAKVAAVARIDAALAAT